MESLQAPNPLGCPAESADMDPVRFLLLFAGLWWKTNQYWKAGRALVAAAILRLRSVWNPDEQARGEKRDLRPWVLAPVDLAAAARVVFSRMASAEEHPLIREMLTEMEQEANALLSYYLLAVYHEEDPCG